jgi:hypothetical protein
VYEMNPKERQIFLVGISTMLWAIWLSRNDIVFNKASISSSMQIIFRETYWKRTWANFQKDQMKNTLQSVCLSDRIHDNGDIRQTWIVVY